LRRLCSRDSLIENRLVAQHNSTLYPAIIGIHDVAETRCRRRAAHKEMIYLSHYAAPNS
jgi:hypothetical protein